MTDEDGATSARRCKLTEGTDPPDLTGRGENSVTEVDQQNRKNSIGVNPEIDQLVQQAGCTVYGQFSVGAESS